jgi:hypothetical protein
MAAKRKTTKRKPTASVIDELYPGFSQRSAKARASNRKGKAHERKVSVALRDVYPGARRLHGQAREGSDCPDVGGTPWWIECTDSDASITSKMRQGLRDSAVSESEEYAGAPVVVISHRKGSTLVLVTMELEQWKHHVAARLTTKGERR